MLHEICDDIKTAVEHGRTDIIKSFLEACDGDPDQNVTKDRILNQPLLEEGTFLCLATKLHQGDVVRTLLSCGADPGVQNSQGMNAVDAAGASPTMRHIYVEELLRATANSEVGRVCQLLAAGIDVNARDSEGSGNAPLHWAACYGDRDVVACLLDRGADVNAMNAFGATPLHDAMFRGDEDIVDMLLQAGANPLIQAVKGKFAGKTALDMAAQKPGLKELVDRCIPLPSSPVESPLPASVGVNGFSQPPESETEADSSGQERSKSADSSGSGGGGVGGGGHAEPAREPARVPALSKVAGVHRRSSRPPRPDRHSLDYFPPHPIPLPHPSVSTAASTLSLDLDPHIDQAIESLLRTHVGTAPIRPLVTHPALHLLWPQPASTLELDGPPFVPSKELGISVVQGPVSVHRILDVWEVSRPCFLAMGYDVRIGDVQPSCGSWTGHRVECLVNPELFGSADSYQIHVSSEKVQVWAGGLAGLHYALGTFAQLLRLAGPEAHLPPVLVRDRPAVAHRGVLLDVSPQGRVPTLNSLFLMVNLWSSMKVNYLHLYTRLVPSTEWQLCYSRSNVVSLDRYCQDRFMTVVPALDVDNSTRYDDLAGMWPSFQEILASFPNLRYVHIGPKLCSLLLAPAGEGQAGAGAARELWHLLALPPAATLMLCANSLQPAAPSSPLPANVVLVQYGFQADYSFVDAAQDYYTRGVTTCLCPGTASWNSLAGCPEAAVCNTYRAARAAVATGSLGVVVAHWSGSHHLTPHTFGWPGFLAGCGLAWNPDTHWDYLHNSLPDLLDAHIFLDSAGVMGATVVGLGRAETYVTFAGRELGGGGELADLPPQGGSTLYRLLTDPDNVALDCLSVDLFARVTKYIKKCQNMFFRAKLECESAEVILREVQLSADLLLTACRIGRTLVAVGMNPNSNMGLAVINLGICNLPPTFRTDIANKLLAHIEQYKGAWLQSQLPAGLQGSLLVLTSALHRFVPDETQPS